MYGWGSLGALVNHGELGDALIWTAAAYYVIGTVLLVMAVRVWWMHPVNRVFLFGPYVTERGIKEVLNNWHLLALFGAFIFSCGIEHHAHWLFAQGKVSAQLVKHMGQVEAAISLTTAFFVVVAAWRLWRKA